MPESNQQFPMGDELNRIVTDYLEALDTAMSVLQQSLEAANENISDDNITNNLKSMLEHVNNSRARIGSMQPPCSSQELEDCVKFLEQSYIEIWKAFKAAVDPVEIGSEEEKFMLDIGNAYTSYEERRNDLTICADRIFDLDILFDLITE